MPSASLRVAAACAAAVLLLGVRAHGGATDGGGFYFESTSQLVSKRVSAITRKHTAWLTADALRFDDGDVLTTIVRLDTGEILIASPKKKAFIRQQVRNVGSVLLELGETMARYVGPRVIRTRSTKLVGGRPCTLRRVELGPRHRLVASVWVEDESLESFEAVRALARQAAAKMGGTRSSLVLSFGGLRGMPREVSVGDPERLQLTWTVERYERKPVAGGSFDLPAAYVENPRLPAAAFTLPEHTYFLAEATARYFAPSPLQRHRSLLPRDFALTSEKLLKDFYEGRLGSEQLGIFRWAKPLTFYLAPELWRYPLSGRALKMLLDIGVCFRGGGLKYYPGLKVAKTPAT